MANWTPRRRWSPSSTPLGKMRVQWLDHLIPTQRPDDTDDGRRLETLTFLGATAATTTNALTGALVFGDLYRHRVIAPKSTAITDHISAGRLDFAFGAPSGQSEFRANRRVGHACSTRLRAAATSLRDPIFGRDHF